MTARRRCAAVRPARRFAGGAARVAPSPSATRCGSPSPTAARIEQGRGLYFFKEEPGRPHRPQQVYSGGGTDGNPRWIPTYGAPHDKATWELIATVPARAHRGVQRTAGERSPRARRTADDALGAGEAGLHLPHLAGGGPLVKVTDRWRERPARVLRLSRGQRARPSALRHHAGHDGDLRPADRRAVSVGQVRADHGRRLHRRHGERRRDDAGGLAARRARLPRPALVPARR